MKKSVKTFVQDITQIGNVRTVNGRIFITIHQNSDFVTGTHAITHDDYNKEVISFSVNVNLTVDGKNFKNDTTDKLKNDVQIEKAIVNILNDFRDHLIHLSNTPPTDSLEDKLAKLGFKEGDSTLS